VNAQITAILDALLAYISFCSLYRFNNEENPSGMTSELLRRGKHCLDILIEGCVDCLYRIAKVYGEYCIVGCEANRAVMRRFVDGQFK
jgi:hypothetical protein